IDIKATGLNWSEVMIRRGDWPMEFGDGLTLGVEGAGIVEAIGPEVEDIKPGDRVANFELLAYELPGQGNYAEKIVVAEDKVLKIPDHLNFAEAAAIPAAMLTAYDALIKHTPLPETGTVVITACTGAVGIAALQLARRKGLRVIGTTRSKSKKSAIAALGVEVVVETDAVRLKEKISDLVGESGIDYVFDAVNGFTATQLLQIMGENSSFVNYGLLSGSEFTVSPTLLFNQVKIHGYVVLKNLANPQTLQAVWGEVLALIEDREVIIPVAKKFPLAEVSAAHRYFEENQYFGKLVLVQ
ncbi:MAG: zinc-binding alcohol dehydrogenase family protein, partial [Nitrospinales bacterium]